MLIPWLNLIILQIATLLFGYLYILSVMPATRAEKRGEKAWKECKLLRSISAIFMLVMLLNLILWIWYPIPELAWPVHPDRLVGIIIGVALLIPCTVVWILGVKAAGGESMTPSRETQMYGGIYNHIRHPQTLGEFPWYVVCALFINSLFLVLWSLIFILVYTPIMIHFEEKDLVKRFGEAYREYQQRTGALFPKIRKQQTRND